MITFILISVICVLIAQLIRQRREHFHQFIKLGIPGPPPGFWLGNLYEIQQKSLLLASNEWHDKYGDVVGYYHGYHPVLLIADNEIVKQIQVKDFHDFADKPNFLIGGGQGFYDHSLLVLKGQRWKQVRSILTPSFTSSKLKKLVPSMCDLIDRFIQNLDKKYQDAPKESFDISVYFQALTLDLICNVALGSDEKIQENVSANKILERLKVLFDIKMNVVASLFASFASLEVFVGCIIRLVLRFMNKGADPFFALMDGCDKIIQQRRQGGAACAKNDLLQMMIEAHEGQDTEEQGSRKMEALSHMEVRDNAFLVLIAGFETSSSTLAFVSRFLLRFPEVQERTREEVIRVTNNGEMLDVATLKKCQYLDAVINETLRLYPPVYAFTARTANCEKTYGNVRIPKGMTILVSLPRLQRSSEHFPDPDEFIPERFLDRDKSFISNASWQPFGNGPRNCIGMRLAQIEMKIALIKLLCKYRLVSPGEPLYQSFIETRATPSFIKMKDPISCFLEPL